MGGSTHPFWGHVPGCKKLLRFSGLARPHALRARSDGSAAWGLKRKGGVLEAAWESDFNEWMRAETASQGGRMERLIFDIFCTLVALAGSKWEEFCGLEGRLT